MKTSRELVLEALCKMQTKDAFSNIVIDKLLTESKLDIRDRAFASKLFYGVIERKITLDFCISKYSKMPMNKISYDILNILRMGIYQLVFMKSVPDNAAVNESVKLVEKVKKISAKGFVNAILRSFLRDDKKIPVPNHNKFPKKYLSVKYSCPERLIEKWQNEYGEENTEQILKASIGAPPIFIRVNTEKTDKQELKEKLEKSKITVSEIDECDNCLIISNSGGIENLKEYREGLFYVQDLASQLLCNLIAPKSGETIFDMCAAPGGKSFTMAQYIKNDGHIFALDMHNHRVNLIKKGAERLSLYCIETKTNDATVFDDELGLADKVLCDVPCSGFGVIRRKPEIKYKNIDEFDSLNLIQKNILDTSSKYVKKGGVLIYSTCTLSKAENDAVADDFLLSHTDFSPCIINRYDDYKHTFLPCEHNSDGFFVAMFKKNLE